MIIGSDLMAKIGICINTGDKNVHWEGSTTPLRHQGELSGQEMSNQACVACSVPPVLLEAKERQARILDANCKKVKLDEFVKELSHSDNDKQQA